MGDTHSTDITDQILQFKISKLNPGCDLIHMGDGGWGGGLYDSTLDNTYAWCKIINDRCNKLDVMLYHIRGNHENPVIWKEIAGEYSNLKFVDTGDELVFPNGKKALIIGGGISVDRFIRKEGIDYWKDEITQEVELTDTYDVVFSHDCPEYFNFNTNSLYRSWYYYVNRDSTLIAEAEQQRNRVGALVEKSGAKELYYGHFHNSTKETVNGIYGQCIDINELYEYDAN